MDGFLRWLDPQPLPTRRRSLLLLAVLPLIAATTMGYAFKPVVPFVGALAGAALFLAGYGWFHAVLTPHQQATVDLKAHYALKPRRGLVGAVLAMWVIVLLLAGRHVPDSLIGTLNVGVALSLYWLWRATPEEAEAQREAWEAAQAAAEEADDEPEA